MRYVKTTLCAAVVLGTLLMATPALATEFFASRNPTACSETAPCQTTGKGVGTADPEYANFPAEFQLGAFNILCEKVHTYAKTAPEGAVTWEFSEVFKTQVKFGKCFAVARFGSFKGAVPTSFNEGKPLTLEYRPNQEVGKEIEGAVELERATMKVGKICKIGWGGQTLKSKKEKPVATFATNEETLKGPSAKFPEGVRDRLEIGNAFTGILFEYEEGQCVGEGGFEEGAEKTEGKSGNFDGQFLITLKEGSIGGE